MQTLINQIKETLKQMNVEHESIIAHNNYLKEVIESLPEDVRPDIITTRELVVNLRQEYEALALNQMTPKMEGIIQAVHDSAGRNSNETGDIVLTVSNVEYMALCDEEAFRAQGGYMGILSEPDENQQG